MQKINPHFGKLYLGKTSILVKDKYMYVCMYWRIPPPRNFCNQERKLSQYHAICTAIAKKTKIGELGAVIIIVYYIVLSFQYQTPLCTHCVSIFYLRRLQE